MNYLVAVRRFEPENRQRGVVLIIAMIALVAITLAALALMRSVDTGLVIAGNLAFKQSTIQVGDAGAEQAIEWLTNPANASLLVDDSPAAGYYATWRKDQATLQGCDITGGETSQTDDDVVWQAGGSAEANCGMVAVPVGSDRLPDGYAATYVINRMCKEPGSPNAATNYCSSFESPTAEAGSTKGGGAYGQLPLTGSPMQYYRITTRIVGPRNTESYVQAIIAF